MSMIALAVQAEPVDIHRPLEHFATQCDELLQKYPDTQLLIFPEMHLYSDGQLRDARPEVLRGAAEPLDGPRCDGLATIARDRGIWLIPGTICEQGSGGELFNTAVVLSPDGGLHHYYRKVFPWRPSEPYDPGKSFTVCEIPGAGTIGLCICFDSWFPEVSRQLTWLGAQTIINLVKTTTPDRSQEMVIARANAIVNQVNFLTLNAAGPIGVGNSAFFGPQGEVIAELADASPGQLQIDLDPAPVRQTRKQGTAGVSRPWAFFSPGDHPVDLPAYHGYIDPGGWNRD